MEWKTVIPTVLDGEPYAWEVTSEVLNSPDPTKAKTAEGKAQQKNFNIGNKAARYVLFNSIHTELAVEMFASNSQTIEAPEIWRAIKAKFQDTNGLFKSVAMADFTN